ncbi:MAG TPA: hypothetical protein ENG50_05390 [Candidatus Altiarchaeales archaeon]|nr:hypothetical protein [Candidatus Altiarchaeales archaeon]
MSISNFYDWELVKTRVEFKRKPIEIPKSKREKREKELTLSDFSLTKTDIEIIKFLIKKKEAKLCEIRNAVKKSRIAIYFSLKKLEEFSIITKVNNLVSLSDNYLANHLKKLDKSKTLEYVVGKRLNVLKSLLEWKSAHLVSKEVGISVSSAYKYIDQLSDLLERSGDKYRIKPTFSELREFLEMLRKESLPHESSEEIWSLGNEKLIKSKIKLGLPLTSFSKFPELGIDHKVDEYYHFHPSKELSLEEIFVHSLKSSKNIADMSSIFKFLSKYESEMDFIEIEKLADKYGVYDLWFDINAYVSNKKDLISNELFSTELNAEVFPKLSKDFIELDEFIKAENISPETLFLANLLSENMRNVINCIEIVNKKHDDLDWNLIRIVLNEEINRNKSFPGKVVLSRLKLINKKLKRESPYLKILERDLLENAIYEHLSNNGLTVRELQAILEIPEYQIRNILNKMLREGKIEKLETSPIKYVRKLS